MELIPPHYECADDGQDLTDLVREKLEDRDPYTFADTSDGFRVIVTCPGGAAAHATGVTGRVRYERP
jgi:hypothetical protein